MNVFHIKSYIVTLRAMSFLYKRFKCIETVCVYMGWISCRE